MQSSLAKVVLNGKNTNTQFSLTTQYLITDYSHKYQITFAFVPRLLSFRVNTLLTPHNRVPSQK